MELDLIKMTITDGPEPRSRIVVRLTTNYYCNNQKAVIKKELRFLKRKSYGDNFFIEDCGSGGDDIVIKSIENLDECEDGIYELVTCDVSYDWETGYADGWNWKLIEYKESDV
jgi:hypothetical protein